MMSEHRPVDFERCASVVENADVGTSEAVDLMRACHNAQPETSVLTPLFLGLIVGALLSWHFAPLLDRFINFKDSEVSADE
jgi:hypothetical protein